MSWKFRSGGDDTISVLLVFVLLWGFVLILHTYLTKSILDFNDLLPGMMAFEDADGGFLDLKMRA